MSDTVKSSVVRQDETDEKTMILLFGNKMDLVDERTPQLITKKLGTRLANVSHLFTFHLTSCLYILSSSRQ